jgi:hypothetical protein
MYKSNLAASVTMLRRAATSAASAGADTFVVAMRLALSGPSPSRPGNVPGMRSGCLKRSITAVPFRQQPDDAEYIVQIDPTAAGPKKTPPWLYGIFLENGTSRMAPRPFFAPISNNSSIQASAFRKATEAARKEFA